MKKTIIIASFGTSHKETRKLCIESIEERIKEKYRNFLILRVFTSQIIINRIRERENYLVYSLSEAFGKIRENKVNTVYLTPLFILPGKEYRKLTGQVQEFFKGNPPIDVQIGSPLLFHDMDYDKVVEGLSFGLESEEGIVFMGHGSDSFADKCYEKLEGRFRHRGYENIFIGSLKGNRTIDNIIPVLKKKNIKRVRLMPFMLVAGKHAIDDMMAGENSWEKKLLSQGIKVEVLLKGLGQIRSIQDIYMDHLGKLFT